MSKSQPFIAMPSNIALFIQIPRAGKIYLRPKCVDIMMRESKKLIDFFGNRVEECRLTCGDKGPVNPLAMQGDKVKYLSPRKRSSSTSMHQGGSQCAKCERRSRGQHFRARPAPSLKWDVMQNSGGKYRPGFRRHSVAYVWFSSCVQAFSRCA